MIPARNAWIGLALAAFSASACGGKQKGPTEGTQLLGSSGEGAVEVPKLDASRCDPKEMDVATFDLNRDNRPDVWKLYRVVEQKGTPVQVMTCKQVDLDHDGKIDYVAHFNDAGAILAEEYDFDFDGKFDARHHYDLKTGRIYLKERTTSFGARPDTWEKYEDGKLSLIVRDRNGDEKPDYWEQYSDGNLDAILFDDDFDGRVDRKDVAQRAAAKGEATAEAPAEGEEPASEE